jgi:DNA polymerase-3 subunit gamma/tau
LPVTVLSRCQRYEFKRLTVAEIADRLRYVSEQEQVAFEPEALDILAEASDGALRDALSLFDQAVAVEGKLTAAGAARMSGMMDRRQVESLVEAMTRSIHELVEAVTEIRSEGVDDKLILRDLARQLRDILLFRVGGDALFPAYRRESLRRLDALLPDSVEPAWWIHAADQLAAAESRLRGGFPAQLAVELALLKLQQELQEASGALPDPASSPELRSPKTLEAVARNDNNPVPARDPYQAVLDVMKRERPSTYALFDEWASGTWSASEGLVIQFKSSVHFNLVQDPHHKEVLERAIKAVLGDDSGYQLRLQEGTGTVTQGSPRSLAEEVRDWFGAVPLLGFDEPHNR